MRKRWDEKIQRRFSESKKKRKGAKLPIFPDYRYHNQCRIRYYRKDANVCDKDTSSRVGSILSFDVFALAKNFRSEIKQCVGILGSKEYKIFLQCNGCISYNHLYTAGILS